MCIGMVKKKKKWRVEIERRGVRYRFGRFYSVETAAVVARRESANLDAYALQGIPLTRDERARREKRREIERRKWDRRMAARVEKYPVKRSKKQLEEREYKRL